VLGGSRVAEGGSIPVDQFAANMQAAGLLLTEYQVRQVFRHLGVSSTADGLAFEAFSLLMGTPLPPMESATKQGKVGSKATRTRSTATKTAASGKRRKAAATTRKAGHRLFQAATA